MRILVINPNTSEEMTRDIGEAARRYARPGTEIEMVCPEWGPRSIEGHYEDYVAAVAALEVVVQAGDAVPGQNALHAQLFGRPQRGPRVGMVRAAKIGQDPNTATVGGLAQGEGPGLSVGCGDFAFFHERAQVFEGTGRQGLRKDQEAHGGR